MGREVRKVPPDWQHPKVYRYGEEKYQPMYDTSFKEAEADWLADFDRIRAGEMTELEKECYPEGLMAWANDESPPIQSITCRIGRTKSAHTFRCTKTHPRARQSRL